MRIRPLSVVMILCWLLAFAGVAQAKTVKVTESSAGRTVHIAPGDVLQLTLTEVRDGGFRWSTVVPPAKSILKTISTRYAPPHLAPGETGGEGKRINRYRGVRAGRTRIQLQYIGPASAPVVMFTMTVVVR